MTQQINKYFAAYWVGTALILGVLIHFFSILSMPYLAPANAWSRLKSTLVVNHMKVLPPPTKGQPFLLPMQSSDVRYAVCRYDITDGPVLITAEIPDDLWSVALYTKDGENFDLIKGADLKLNLLRLKLFKKKSNPGVDDHIRAAESQNALTDERSIDINENTGIIIIRAPLGGQAFSKEAQAFLSNATCNQLKAAPTVDNS